MDDIKEALKTAITKNAGASGAAFTAEDAEGFSQAALNLSATLAQIANIEVAEAHLALDRQRLEEDDEDVPAIRKTPGQGVH